MSNADERIRENMKSYNHLYENCISEENRRISLNLAKHSKRMRRIMKSRHLSDDALVALSYDWINNYENAEHVPVYIYDGITRKERVIIVPHNGRADCSAQRCERFEADVLQGHV